MRTLPDKAFQLAIADPPYGGAGNDISGQNEIRNCRGRFDKYKQIDCARTGGTWAAKYGKTIYLKDSTRQLLQQYLQPEAYESFLTHTVDMDGKPIER
jgi:hypothetical protein